MHAGLDYSLIKAVFGILCRFYVGERVRARVLRVASDGQSCFPAGLRGPVFLGFSLALINSGVPPLPPCPFGPCPTPPLPREPGPCILGPFPPPATLGVPPEAGLWNLRVCPSSLRLCGALRTLDSGFCASNSGALCWRPSGLRTVDSGWVAEGMARSPDSGFWIV